jgi:hypothetical protein
MGDGWTRREGAKTLGEKMGKNNTSRRKKEVVIYVAEFLLFINNQHAVSTNSMLATVP